MRMIPIEQEPGRERSAPYYREQERRMRNERMTRNPMRDDMEYRRGGNYARAGRTYSAGRSYPRNAMDNRMRMGRIGFEYDDGYDMRGGRGGTYMHGDGGSHGDYEMGHGGEDYGLTYDEAEEWVRSMKNADGSKGGKWKMEELEKILRERGIKCDILAIYAGMNALYSDLGEVCKKYGITDKNVNFWLEAAIAYWIEDDDAVEDKLAVYYDCIVE